MTKVRTNKNWWNNIHSAGRNPTEFQHKKVTRFSQIRRIIIFWSAVQSVLLDTQL
jgi:hypothetical protein